HPFADAVHVALQVGIGIEGRGAEEARREVVAERDLLVVGPVLVGLGGLLGDVDGLVDDAAEVDRGGGSGGERQRDAGEDGAFHRMASGVSIFTAASLASRAKRSAVPLSTRYECSFASSAGLGLAFFRSSGLRPRMPVVARLALRLDEP